MRPSFTHSKVLISLFSLLFLVTSLSAQTSAELIDQALLADHRGDGNHKRDVYRHPKEVLLFLGLEPDMSVVEIWPSSGWWTEILAPVLRKNGAFFAAGFSMTADRTPQWRKKSHMALMHKLDTHPDVYDHVVVTELSIPERTTMGPPGKVDIVLTFRNVHNWMNGSYEQLMFKSMSRVLRSGGILGIVEHRANPGTSIEEMKKTGYVTEEYVIQLANNAGFTLDGSSELNANMKDSKNHPAGVWSLPPSLRTCRDLNSDIDKNNCIEMFTEIGESDRMTLRFIKK